MSQNGDGSRPYDADEWGRGVPGNYTYPLPGQVPADQTATFAVPPVPQEPLRPASEPPSAYAPNQFSEPQSTSSPVVFTVPLSGGTGGASSQNSGLIVVVTALTVIVIGISAFLFLGGTSPLRSIGGASQSASNPVTASPSRGSAGAADADTRDSSSSSTSRRASDFSAPSNWSKCSGSGSYGDFNYAYSGRPKGSYSPYTSCGFASNVRDAFVSYYRSTGSTEGTITAYSPQTKRSYDMTCSDNGEYVTCRGGNAAVVHIV